MAWSLVAIVSSLVEMVSVLEARVCSLDSIPDMLAVAPPPARVLREAAISLM